MKDKTGRKVKTFELKTFEVENKTGRKVEEQSGNRGKKSGFKTLSNFCEKSLFIKVSLPKDVPTQSGVLACGFPITLNPYTSNVLATSYRPRISIIKFRVTSEI